MDMASKSTINIDVIKEPEFFTKKSEWKKSNKYGTTELMTTLTLRIVVIIVFGFIGYNLRHIFDPVKRGFWCSDKSIRLPFHESTIENTTLFYISIILVSIMIFVGEFFYNNNETNSGEIEHVHYWKMHNFLWKTIQLFRFSSIWMLGIVVSIILVNVLKISVGSLRPNFIQLCKPKNKQNKYVNCDDKDIYILPTEYECANAYGDRLRIMDAKMSFYSGHSSTSFFFATFIIIYTHLRIAQKSSYKDQFLSIFVVFYSILLSLAAFVAASRIFDNKHHPIDVFVGSFAGTFIAILTVFLHKEIFFEKSGTFQKETTISSVKNIEEKGITENSRV